MKKYCEIEQWLKKYNITNYTIRDDLVVDVDDDVTLHNKNLTELPFQFGKVVNFYCYSNHLTSLKHCPTTVTAYFDCSDNPLISLEHCPTTVGESFYCDHNTLTSLQYCPTTVGGDFICHSNKLTSLQHFPTSVGGDLYCSNNPFIVTKENESEWFEAIKNHKGLYSYIKEPTEALTALYKMIWEI